MKAWLFVVVVVLPIVGLTAKEREQDSGKILEQLVRELDDDNYSVRENALEKLSSAGLPVLQALEHTLLEGSPEAAWRANAALEQIALRGNEAQMQQVVNLYKKLSRQKPSLAGMAKELAIRQQWARHEHAVAQLRSLGGQVQLAEGEYLDEAIELDAGVDGFDAVDVAMPEEEDALPAEPGIFGAIRAIARALLPELPDPDAPPEPLEVMPAEAEPPVESPDVEIVERAVPAAEPDVGIVELPGPAIDAVDVGFAFADLDGGVMPATEGFGSGAVSQITLNKNWLGGDDKLALLKDVKGLTTLVLEDASITDAALPRLEGLAELRQVTIRGGQLTGAALRKWRVKRPEVQIWAIGSAMMGVGADMSSSPLVLNHIYPRSGAQDAGLAAGDLVKRIDGEAIGDFTDLMLSVFQRKVGEKLQVDFERDGKLRRVEVALKSRQTVERAATEDESR